MARYTILLLTALLLPAESSAASFTEREMLDAMVAQFDRLCIKANPKQALQELSSQARYERIGTGKKGHKALDRQLEQQFGRKFMITIKKDACKLSAWPNTKHLIEDLDKRIQAKRWGSFHYRGKNGEMDGEKIQYRNPAWERTGEYLRLQVYSGKDSDGDFLSLGVFVAKREKLIDTINFPGTRWTAKSVTIKSARYFFATLDTDRHSLRIMDKEGDAWLLFEPSFYRFPASRKKGSKGYFLKAMRGLRVDGKSLAAYQTCAKNGSNCSFNNQGFYLKLKPRDLQQLQRGAQLTLKTRTTLKETVEFEIPLAGLTRAVEVARARNAAQGMTPIAFAVANKDHDKVRRLLAGGADPNTAYKATGAHLVHIAARAKDPRMLRLLVKAGADINARDNDGDTVLHAAAHFGSADDVQLALALGADVSIKDSIGRTPLMRTVHYGEGLRKYDLLLKAGADINATDNRGQTELFGAATPYVLKGHEDKVDRVEYLLKHGASVNHRAKDGSTALFHAMTKGHDNIVRYLLKHGARTDIRLANGKRLIDGLKSAGSRRYYRSLVKYIDHYRIGFHNKTGRTVQVAVHYLNDRGDWVTKAWYEFKPGAKAYTNFGTKNRIIYWYARAGNSAWSGPHRYTVAGRRYGFTKETIPREKKGLVKHIIISD